MRKSKLLLLSIVFRPNLGGVETHLDDLCEALIKRGISIRVLTYRPLQTKVNWTLTEEGKGIKIVRLPWLPNLFYKLVSYPVLEFIYLLPGLFIVTPFLLLLDNPDVINAHGIVAGFVGVVWGRIFKKRVVISLHSIYNFPQNGIYRKFVKWIFNNSDYILTLSKQSKNEVESLGISTKVNNFTYWIDLTHFKNVNNAKNKLSWDNQFIVLFVGRLIREKGLEILLESSALWDKKITLIIIGTGPLASKVEDFASRQSNIKFLGLVTQNELPIFYSAADIVIMPSTSEEGYGRVILESLACGTPVIGARRGAIPEAMDNSVGKLIDVNMDNIKEVVEYFYDNQNKLKNLSNNCRKFAERKYSEKNADTIIKAYAKEN